MRESLVRRVRGVLFAPQSELPKAIAEAGDLPSLLRYVLPLAAIGAVARFVSAGVIGVYVPPQMMFGMKVGGGFVRTPVGSLVGAALSLAVGIGAWGLFAYLLHRLAPTFGARPDQAGARKVAAYALTPVWLAGGLALLHSVPYLGIVSSIGHLAGLVYAVLVGTWALPLLMGSPEAKAPAHILAAMGVTVVAVLIVGFTYGVFFGAAASLLD